ncbi:MAG TPA: PorP/SprF family type IX secretion system membrane protein [Bacteroidales bacterium]|jgi:type IX secretion system PorP/SprF family membrane protein|nr:PorP/SprF family type IX secretion system membrane protein [Bacteroidales bacterium]
MKSITIFLLILICISTRAQELIFPDLEIKPLPFSMFWNSKSLFNPAASGVDNRYYAAVAGGEQWIGTNYEPRDIGVILAMKSDFLHGAIGMNYVHTAFPEVFKIHNLNAIYSYHINLGNEKILSAGISGGISLVTSDYTMYDPPFYNEKSTNSNYNLQLGMLYRSDHLQLGLSSHHFEYTDIYSAGKEISSNIYIYSSYRFDIGEILDINPQLLITRHKSYTEIINLSSGLLFAFKERFWTGFTYRTDNTYGGLAGFDIAGIVRIGYSYEIRTKVSGIENYGNHELLVALMLR